MIPLETARLFVRELALADAGFILELLNEPSFHHYIGDKGVRDLAGAERYLREGPLAMYARCGFGLWLVASKDGTPLGLCGPLQRDSLPHPDLGFAFLARHHGQGYAHESAAAVLTQIRRHLIPGPLLAITAPVNPASAKLLTKLGFRFDRIIELPGYPEPSRLYVLPPAPQRFTS